MVSEKNRKAIEAAGLSFILGMKIPDIPWVVTDWHCERHPGVEVSDGQIFTQPWPAPTRLAATRSSTTSTAPTWARRTLRGIDEQVSKAEKAVAGKIPVKRNRFITITGATKTVNRKLEAKARGLAGFKGYITYIEDPNPEFGTAYHQLWHIEKSFRMNKHDLQLLDLPPQA